MSIVKETSHRPGIEEYYTNSNLNPNPNPNNNSIDIDNDDNNDGANEALLNSMIGSLLEKDVHEQVKDYYFSQRGTKRPHDDNDYDTSSSSSSSTHSSYYFSSGQASSSSNNTSYTNESVNSTFFGSNFSEDMEEEEEEEASPISCTRLPTGESAKKLSRTLAGPLPLEVVDEDGDYHTTNRMLFPPQPQTRDVEDDDGLGLLLSLRRPPPLASNEESKKKRLDIEWSLKMAELSKWEAPKTSSEEEDYFAALRYNEERTRPGCNAMEKQVIINAEMRGILIDWLSEVTDWYGLNEEILFLSVNYVDRFLCVRGVDKQAFQMLGLAAMFSASKYEELDPPTSSDFAVMINKSTPNTLINRMEIVLGAGIGFDYCVATSLAFLKALTSFDKRALPSPDHFQQAFSCAIVI